MRFPGRSVAATVPIVPGMPGAGDFSHPAGGRVGLWFRGSGVVVLE